MKTKKNAILLLTKDNLDLVNALRSKNNVQAVSYPLVLKTYDTHISYTQCANFITHFGPTNENVVTTEEFMQIFSEEIKERCPEFLANKTNTNSRFPFTLKSNLITDFFNSLPEDCKDKMVLYWGKRIIEGKDIKIDKEFYTCLRKHSKVDQTLLDITFGKDIPKNIPKQGTPVFILRNGCWKVRIYDKWNNGHEVIVAGYLSGHIMKADKISLTNPLTEGETLI